MEQDSELDDIEDLFFLLLLKRGKNKKRRRKRRFWVRKLYTQRYVHGSFCTLFPELVEDREVFFRYHRMTPDRFEHLLSLVKEQITKKDTKFRKAIPAKERLSATLRFLATGETQQSISFSYRIGRTTVSNIIAETCQAIFQVLKHEYLRAPKDLNEWKKISDDFEEYWNFPHVIGALNGKHIRMECPKKSGSLYYNYKGYFSLVLLAICDANYCFTLFDIGAYGNNNDSGVLANSEMGAMFENSTCSLPTASDLSGCDYKPLPYYLLGDEIFPLKSWLLKPFPGKNLPEKERIYNYRHSIARRTIENTFGILAARWRILLTPIRASVENVQNYVFACIALHNYLRLTHNAVYTPSGFIDSESNDGAINEGDWRSTIPANSFLSLQLIHGSRPNTDCARMRNNIKDYFCTYQGSVSWQEGYVRRTYNEKEDCTLF